MADETLLYRAMSTADDRAPDLGATSRTLGARPRIDVPGDASDEVEPGSGGMSVSSGGPDRLPDHRRPANLGGAGKAPVFVITASSLGPDLQWRPDEPDGPLGHGFVEPVRRMRFSEYREGLWATRSRRERWSDDPT